MSHWNSNSIILIIRNIMLNLTMIMSNTLSIFRSFLDGLCGGGHWTAILQFNFQILVIDNGLVDFLSINSSSGYRVIESSGSLLELGRLGDNFNGMVLSRSIGESQNNIFFIINRLDESLVISCHSGNGHIFNGVIGFADDWSDDWVSGSSNFRAMDDSDHFSVFLQSRLYISIIFKGSSLNVHLSSTARLCLLGR